MDPIQSVALILTVLASVWAAQSAITSGWKYANELRDAVIIGRIGPNEITVDHAEIIRDNDHRSAFFGLVLSAFSFSILLLYIGSFSFLSGMNANRWEFTAVGVIGLMVGLMHLGRALGTLSFYRSEKAIMNAAISTRRAAQAIVAGPPAIDDGASGK